MQDRIKVNKTAWYDTLKKHNIDDELLEILTGEEKSSGPRAVMDAGLAAVKSAYEYVHAVSAMDECAIPPYVTVANLLRVRKAVVNLRDSFGRTALMIAAALGQAETVALLLREGE